MTCWLRSAIGKLYCHRKGEVPPSHWFRLGRALTPVDRGSALVSWSGSMFEYLMPALVMRSPAGSLLSQTYDLVVRGKSNMVPSAECPGGCRNRPTMRATSISRINTPALAYPVGPQARPERGYCHRALCHRACGHGGPNGGIAKF